MKGLWVVVLSIIVGFSVISMQSNITVSDYTSLDGGGHCKTIYAWNYFIPIDIKERSGNDLTNYQVSVELNQSNFNFSLVNPNGSDIRFYDSNNNSLSFWIEIWDYPRYALIWVKVPFIQANSITRIYMRFGNPNAPPASDPYSTFDFYDGIEDGVADGWQDVSDGNPSQTDVSFDAVTNPVVHGQYAEKIGLWSQGDQSSSHARVRKALSINENQSLSIWFNYYQFGGHNEPLSFRNSSDIAAVGLTFRSYWGGDTYNVNGIDTGKVLDLQKWYKLEIKNISYSQKTVDVIIYNSDGSIFDSRHGITFADTNASSIDYFCIYQSSWHTYQWAYYIFDSYYIRKFVHPEPLVIVNDDIPPTVNIISPPNNSYLNTSQVTLKWSASDNYGIDHFEVSKDGTNWINVGTSAQYTFTNLSDGKYTLYVKAYDYIGNTASDSINITIDTTPPSLNIIFPSSGDIVNPNVTLIWNASDSLGIDHYEVSDGGNTWINVGTSTQYQFHSLSTGNHSLYVRAWDLAGNSAVCYVDVIVDAYIPKVYIIYPSSNMWLNKSEINLLWSGSDNEGINHYEVSDGGNVWINVGLNNTYTFTNMSDGEHILFVKVVDVVGNVGIDSVKIYIDTVSPSVKITSPEKKYISSDTIILRWVMDDNFGISKCKVFDGYCWINVSSNTTLCKISNLTEGEHCFKIEVWDYAGNTNYSEINVTVDLSPPSLTITEPINGSYYSVSDVNVSWSASDNIGLDSVRLRVDNQQWLNVSGNRYSLKNLEDGKHTIEIEAVDFAGNYIAREVDFVVDTQAPYVEIISPINGSWLNDNIIILQWTATDNLNVYEIHIFLDSTDVLLLGEGNTSCNISVNEGMHTIGILAKDYAGNAEYSEITIGIDLTAPSLYANINNDKISIIARDNLSGVAWIVYSIDNSSWINLEDNGTVSINNLSAGTHIIRIMAADYAGNTAYYNKTFEIAQENIPTQPTTSFSWCFILLIILLIAFAIILSLVIYHYNKELKRIKNFASLALPSEEDKTKESVEENKVEDSISSELEKDMDKERES